MNRDRLLEEARKILQEEKKKSSSSLYFLVFEQFSLLEALKDEGYSVREITKVLNILSKKENWSTQRFTVRIVRKALKELEKRQRKIEEKKEKAEESLKDTERETEKKEEKLKRSSLLSQDSSERMIELHKKFRPKNFRDY